jgi:general secretion pathway protein A
MYQSFYGLKRSPFENCPDPFFFYPSPNHQEALTALYYGVQTRRGFLMLTGEVGTGKTLLIRCLAGVLNRSHISFAYVVNPRLSEPEFLKYIITDLHLRAEGDKSTTLFQLNDYLLSRDEVGSTTALIVDEAHLLSWEVLEEIRLLTNLETSNHKLLQIILVGQPELDHTIDSPDLRQLKQRIALRRRLLPLTAEQIRCYVQSRLELSAGSPNGREIFSKPAIAEVEKYSRGIPRLINTICENALAVGYAVHSPTITAQIVDEIAVEFGFSELDDEVLAG